MSEARAGYQAQSYFVLPGVKYLMKSSLSSPSRPNYLIGLLADKTCLAVPVHLSLYPGKLTFLFQNLEKIAMTFECHTDSELIFLSQRARAVPCWTESFK